MAPHIDQAKAAGIDGLPGNGMALAVISNQN